MIIPEFVHSSYYLYLISPFGIDNLSYFYYSRMNKKMGAGTIDARIVLGALIIKHHENLSDEATILAITENVYMQYFLGLPSVKRDAVFVPSLFVEIRKRLGIDYWKEINDIIIKYNTAKEEDNRTGENKNVKERVNSEFISQEEPIEALSNRGTINIDATIIEQDIQFPTDLGILNESREKLEEILDIICLKTGQEKPRTYRIIARKKFLNVSKKKRKTHKEIRRAVGAQLNFVSRDLKHINSLLSEHLNHTEILNKYELKYMQVLYLLTGNKQ